VPKLIGFRTLVVKILGTSLGVSASLAIGKEGPLAHIGAIVGHMVVYMPFTFCKYFQNEAFKREVAAAGAAAGVSAAFGSPIGGSLFAYEISRPSTFWSFDLTWKIFFCSSISTFTLNILICMLKGKDLSITNAGLIKFGEYDEHPYKLQDFPFFIILGIFGGLLGSFFIYVNAELNAIRKKVLKTNISKLMETICLAALTATVLFFTPNILSKNCMSQDESSVDAEHIQYLCPEGMYNPMATFLFNAEGTVIKNFLSKKAVFSYETLLLFFLIWFIFTCITYGTAVPAGLFLPGILIGCSLGRVLGLFIENYIVQEIHPSTYAIIGAAATLAGYSRLSFSLAIIMLETTENVNLFLPIIFALFVSFGIGGIFNKSMYVGAVRSKCFPFLNETVPMCNELITAEQIMSMPPKTLKFRSSVNSIHKVLTENSFDGFPIINSEN
jgi:chloride channel 7